MGTYIGFSSTVAVYELSGPKPVVTLLPVTSITDTSATFNFHIDPKGSCSVKLEYWGIDNVVT